MLYAIVIACLLSNGECAVYQDPKGPTASVPACQARLAEMLPAINEQIGSPHHGNVICAMKPWDELSEEQRRGLIPKGGSAKEEGGMNV